MTGVVLYAAATLLVGGMAILAQRARKSQSAYVTLAVVLLAASFLVAAVGVLTAIGLLLRATGDVDGFEQVTLAAAGVAALVVGITGLGLCVPPLRRILGWRVRNAWWADPPIFLALWLSAILLANNVVSLLVFTQLPNVADIFPTGRLSAGSILLSEIPFLVVAVLGVGFGVWRNPRETLSRLGYGGITLRELGIVCVFVVGALVLSLPTDALFAYLQPDLYRTVGDLSDSLFNTQAFSPVSAVLFALTLGIAAGLGEETLFRGAIQPALGILPSALLFASLHIQYGPSILLVYIFLLAIGFGFLRRYINTTACFIAHAAFNALGVMLAYSFGI